MFVKSLNGMDEVYCIALAVSLFLFYFHNSLVHSNGILSFPFRFFYLELFFLSFLNEIN